MELYSDVGGVNNDETDTKFLHADPSIKSH